MYHACGTVDGRVERSVEQRSGSTHNGEEAVGSEVDGSLQKDSLVSPFERGPLGGVKSTVTHLQSIRACLYGTRNFPTASNVRHPSADGVEGGEHRQRRRCRCRRRRRAAFAWSDASLASDTRAPKVY